MFSGLFSKVFRTGGGKEKSDESTCATVSVAGNSIVAASQASIISGLTNGVSTKEARMRDTFSETTLADEYQDMGVLILAKQSVNTAMNDEELEVCTVETLTGRTRSNASAPAAVASPRSVASSRGPKSRPRKQVPKSSLVSGPATCGTGTSSPGIPASETSSLSSILGPKLASKKLSSKMKKQNDGGKDSVADSINSVGRLEDSIIEMADTLGTSMEELGSKNIEEELRGECDEDYLLAIIAAKLKDKKDLMAIIEAKEDRIRKLEEKLVTDGSTRFTSSKRSPSIRSILSLRSNPSVVSALSQPDSLVRIFGHKQSSISSRNGDARDLSTAQEEHEETRSAAASGVMSARSIASSVASRSAAAQSMASSLASSQMKKVCKNKSMKTTSTCSMSSGTSYTNSVAKSAASSQVSNRLRIGFSETASTTASCTSVESCTSEEEEQMVMQWLQQFQDFQQPWIQSWQQEEETSSHSSSEKKQLLYEARSSSSSVTEVTANTGPSKSRVSLKQVTANAVPSKSRERRDSVATRGEAENDEQREAVALSRTVTPVGKDPVELARTLSPAVSLRNSVAKLVKGKRGSAKKKKKEDASTGSAQEKKNEDASTGSAKAKKMEDAIAKKKKAKLIAEMKRRKLRSRQSKNTSRIPVRDRSGGLASINEDRAEVHVLSDLKRVNQTADELLAMLKDT